MQKLQGILPFVLERLDQQCLAFFIGAGIPAGEAGLPNGTALRDKLLKEMGEKESNESLPEVASRFENDRDRVSLFDFLKGALTFSGNIQDDSICPSYKMLLDLPAQTFVTTNFDNLIEMVAALKKIPLTTFRTDSQLANYKPTQRTLLKVHGDVENAADDITITSEDYDTYSSRNPQFSHRIMDVFHVNTVIFLGYSLTDPDLNHLYNSVLQTVGGLKRKSYAILSSDPGVKIREAWAQKKIEIITSSAQDFVQLLHKAYVERTTHAGQQKNAVRVTAGGKFRLPRFSATAGAGNLRKAFAYFVARQKALIKSEAFSFCTIDTLQSSAEMLDPSKKVAHLISAKVQEISTSLREKGYIPEVLPLLDQVSQRVRRRRIEEASFCIILITSTAYEGHLNRLYGAVASAKPLLVFVHHNLRPRLGEDLVFRGLFRAGAELEIFKTAEINSCDCGGRLKACWKLGVTNGWRER